MIVVGRYSALNRLTLEQRERVLALLEEFRDFAQRMNDAELAYLILAFNKVDCDESPGYYLWQQLALLELRLRRCAEGKR